MNPNELTDLISRHPFVPLKIFLTDGSSYEIIHRDFVHADIRKMIVTLKASDLGAPEHVMMVDPLHVVRIDTHLDVSTAMTKK